MTLIKRTANKALEFTITGSKTIMIMFGVMMLLFVLNSLLEIKDMKVFFSVFRFIIYSMILCAIPFFIKRKNGGVLSAKHKKSFIRLSCLLVLFMSFYEIMLFNKGMSF